MKKPAFDSFFASIPRPRRKAPRPVCEVHTMWCGIFVNEKRLCLDAPHLPLATNPLPILIVSVPSKKLEI